MRSAASTRGGSAPGRRRPGRGGPGEPDDEPPTRVDLRLAPAALAAWAAVLAAVLGGPVGGLLALLTAAAVLVLGGTAGRRRGSRPRRSGRLPVRGGLRGGAGAAVLAAAGCALAAGAVATAAAAHVHGHPLRAAAERGSSAALTVVLTDDPRVVRTAAYGSTLGADRVVVRAELVAGTFGDGQWRGAGRVLLLAPAAGWSGLLPGQQVRAEGLLAPAQRADLTVAVLRVRGAPLEVGEPPWWQTAAGTLREGLREAAGVLPEASAGLLPGLAVGDTRNQTAEVEQDFRTAGLSHPRVR